MGASSDPIAQWVPPPLPLKGILTCSLLLSITGSKMQRPRQKPQFGQVQEGHTFQLSGLWVTKHLVFQASSAGGEDLLSPQLMKKSIFKHQRGSDTELIFSF